MVLADCQTVVPDLDMTRGPDSSISCIPMFAAGTVVIFQNLINQLDLEDQSGTVESYDVGTTRFAVRIHSSGKRARVLVRFGFCHDAVRAVRFGRFGV